MGRLENEARTAMTVLLKQGHSQSSVARLLGVSEGTVRYHRRRDAAGAVESIVLDGLTAAQLKYHSPAT